eukprot:TRINITY_DN7367_c0_g1_i6.p1 TRINITY_DN7367_c0_g1~~TRINITY_DN7367_c0_g1_i6.p1  ORF type:complete len:208 (+),score=43.59 TRINITY_DN7367_c0_g1_i6:124-747(+)
MAYTVVAACVLSSVQGAGAATSRGSSPLPDIAQTMQTLPMVATTDDTGFFDNATAFLDELKDKEAPEAPLKRSLVDPQPVVGFFSCARDTTGCPLGFVAGAENVQVCVPESSYRGPCSTPVDLSSMPTVAKSRWADACQTSWPCSGCTRNYSSCPLGWTPSARRTGTMMCEPPAAYIGACDAASFVGDSVAELESWASSCGAVWPCK